MTQFTIAVIVGSLRKESFNAKLAIALVHLAPAELALQRVAIGDLPLYNQDEDTTPADAVTRFRGAVAAAQGVIFVTAEYNRSIPGVLKNAIDHGSRPYGKSVWSGKPAGVVGVSPGAMGTALAQQHLRNVLSAVDMPTLAQPEVYLQAKEGLFAADGGIGEGSRGFLQGWLTRYAAFVKHSAA
jgi:chromate reductase